MRRAIRKNFSAGWIRGLHNFTFVMVMRGYKIDGLLTCHIPQCTLIGCPPVLTWPPLPRPASVHFLHRRPRSIEWSSSLLSIICINIEAEAGKIFSLQLQQNIYTWAASGGHRGPGPELQAGLLLLQVGEVPLVGGEVQHGAPRAQHRQLRRVQAAVGLLPLHQHHLPHRRFSYGGGA